MEVRSLVKRVRGYWSCMTATRGLGCQVRTRGNLTLLLWPRRSLRNLPSGRTTNAVIANTVLLSTQSVPVLGFSPP